MLESEVCPKPFPPSECVIFESDRERLTVTHRRSSSPSLRWLFSAVVTAAVVLAVVVGGMRRDDLMAEEPAFQKEPAVQTVAPKAGAASNGPAAANSKSATKPKSAAKPDVPRRVGGGDKFQSDRAFDYLTDICKLGSRVSGSSGMEKQQRMLIEHFTALKAKVSLQPFDAAHPMTGNPVRMNNLIVSWHPEREERVLLCCHYDTRPRPDRDPDPNVAANGEFLGANDGASGVAFLMEMGHHLPELKTPYGVDFIIFDGEELVFGERNGTYFLGSRHFANEYKARRHGTHRYAGGVLVDMIGDRQLQIYMERNSLQYAPSVTKGVWATAKRVGITEFVPRERHEVLDDHIPLNQIARIPTCDLIDFDYPQWHTSRDVPAACSGASLAKVGRVLLAWLETCEGVPPLR